MAFAFTAGWRLAQGGFERSRIGVSKNPSSWPGIEAPALSARMFHGPPDCAAFPVLKQGMAGCVKEICKESPRSYLAAGV